MFKTVPINLDIIFFEKDDTFYINDTNKPYSVIVLTVYDNGKMQWEVTCKDGIEGGLVNQRYDNGQKQLELTFNNRKSDGAFLSCKKDVFVRK